MEDIVGKSGHPVGATSWRPVETELDRGIGPALYPNNIYC